MKLNQWATHLFFSFVLLKSYYLRPVLYSHEFRRGWHKKFQRRRRRRNEQWIHNCQKKLVPQVNKTVYWTPDSSAAHYVYPNKCQFMSHRINSTKNWFHPFHNQNKTTINHSSLIHIPITITLIYNASIKFSMPHFSNNIFTSNTPQLFCLSSHLWWFVCKLYKIK